MLHLWLLCAGEAYHPELHQELKEKLRVLNTEARRHPRVYQEPLRQEVAELRRRFADVPPNVEGIPVDMGEAAGQASAPPVGEQDSTKPAVRRREPRVNNTWGRSATR